MSLVLFVYRPFVFALLEFLAHCVPTLKVIFVFYPHNSQILQNMVSTTALILVLITIYFHAFVVAGDVQMNQTVSCIIGEVSVEASGDDWIGESKVVIDSNRFYGFLDTNGKFVVCDVPAGTYVVEVISPYYIFDTVRVDVSSKSGKIRAREINILKVKNVAKVPYPLAFSSDGVTQFFKKRESWSILSSLKNPMVGDYYKH